jgi:hypothetical protein
MEDKKMLAEVEKEVVIDTLWSSSENALAVFLIWTLRILRASARIKGLY